MLNSEKMIASIDQGDLEHAEKYFEKALKYDDSESLLALGQYLEGIGFLPHAKRLYSQIESDYPEVNLNLAQIVAEDGLIEEAFLYLDKIPTDSPDYLHTLIIMADLYDMEGLTDVAHEKLLEAENLSDDPLIIYGLAELEMDLGQFQEAINHYAQLDNRDFLESTGVSTYQRIGRAYASLGKFEAALEFLEKAVEISYDDDTVYELATILYDQEEYQKANLYFKQLEAMNPDYEGYEYAYAQSLHEEHKTAEALRLTQQAIRKNAYDSQLLLLASQLAFEEHDADLSEQYLLEAKVMAEDTEEVIMRLSSLYLDSQRYCELVALDNDQLDNLLSKWNIAKGYQALEVDEKAMAIYQELEAELKENPEFLQDYAYILRDFGQSDKAGQMCQLYLNLVPDDLNMQEFLEELQ